MRSTIGKDVADWPGPASAAGPAAKVVVLAGASWEAAAHCRVLLGALGELARDVVVVRRPRVRLDRADGMDEAPGVSVVGLDGAASWPGLPGNAAEVWSLARILEAERPDVVHVIGLDAATLACLASRLAPAPRMVVHLPHLGALGPGSGRLAWPMPYLTLKLLASLLRKPGSFLLVDCEDALGDLKAKGIDPGPRFAFLGGAGVDPEVYPVLPPFQGEMPIAAFVGPVDERRGVRVLLQAFERLWARGLRLQLEIWGERATGAADPLFEEWDRWSRHPGVRSSGWPADAREVWRRAEICVWPAHAREGVPRVLLEAAACGRALIVSDAAGTFVRNDVEGLVVPAGDASALGAALERLARDAGLRQRMGAAARLRVLQGFTEAHVKETLRGVYLSLLGTDQR